MSTLNVTKERHCSKDLKCQNRRDTSGSWGCLITILTAALAMSQVGDLTVFLFSLG